MHKYLILLFVLLVTAVPVLAQDDAEDAPGDTFLRDPDRQDVVMVPPDWLVSQTQPYVVVENPDRDIIVSVITVQADEASTALADGLSQVSGDAVTKDADITEGRLSNGDWLGRVYTGEDATLYSAFTKQRPNEQWDVFVYRTLPDTYTLIITEPNAADAAASALALIGATAADLTENTPDDAEEGVTTYTTEIDGEPATVWVRLESETNDTQAVLITFDEAVSVQQPEFFRMLDRFFVTPQTTNFLWLGLVASVVLIGGLALSILLRYRNLRRDEQLIRELAEDG